jgi:hypothetical protein
MDVALKTPVAEGRQGAHSEKRPTEVRRSGPEPHFWDISESNLGYQALEDLSYWKISWPTAGTGSRGAGGLRAISFAKPNRGLPRNREKNL